MLHWHDATKQYNLNMGIRRQLGFLFISPTFICTRKHGILFSLELNFNLKFETAKFLTTLQIRDESLPSVLYISLQQGSVAASV